MHNLADRTPIVLALVAEAVHLRACDCPLDEDLEALSDALALAVDHGAVADLWPPTGVDEAHARWLARVLTGDADRDDREGDDALVVATAVARRLADVAASLCVRGGEHVRLARALWRAAERLLGFREYTPAESSPLRPVDLERVSTLADFAAGWVKNHPGLEVTVRENGFTVTTPLATPSPDATARAEVDRLGVELDKMTRAYTDALDQVHAWQTQEAERRRERDHARAEVERLRAAQPYGGRLADAMAEAMQYKTERDEWRYWAKSVHSASSIHGDAGMRQCIDDAIADLRRERDDAVMEVERWRRWAVEKTGGECVGGDTFLRAAIQVHINPDIDRLTRAHAEEVRTLTERLATALADARESIASQPEHVILGRDGRPLTVTIGDDDRPVGPAIVKHPRLLGQTIASIGAANEWRFVWGPKVGELAIVVTLRDGGTIEAIQRALHEHHDLVPGTYRIREVGKPWHASVPSMTDTTINPRRREDCPHREDGDRSACDHCSLKG